MKKLFKSMKSGLKATNGNVDFKVGEWFHQGGTIQACQNGFHACKNIIDAMRYVNCEILAEVEVKGQSDLSEKDKECWSDMKILRAWEWDKNASVRLSIFAAELCLENFEKWDKNDKRPREAIEAAKNWLKNPTAENESARSARSAAWSARSAAWSAWSAESAARSAAWSAAWSARSAESAARSAESAAWSAESAARSAESAARSAESADEILLKCHKFIIKEIIPTLKEIKNDPIRRFESKPSKKGIGAKLKKLIGRK